VTPRFGPELEPDAALPSVEPGATILLATGDIGSCEGLGDDRVEALAAKLPGTIALLGDIAYQDGSAADFANCFDPAWHPLMSRLRPVPGNHESLTPAAGPYFSYFGAVAGTRGEGWYSYDLGSWHIIALNSNCEPPDAPVACGPGSPQLAWLEGDLAASGASRPGACTLAYWHFPRYSSGRHGDMKVVDPFWQALADAGADVVLTGHDHDYERFGSIDGIRSFVVGTGGRSMYEMERVPNPASEVRNNNSYGILMLTLRASDFDWRFVPARGSSLADSGTAACR
jgi:hypothetical protein